MKCGSKKKVKKFAAGGYPAFTSVSSLDEKGELKKPEVTVPKQSFGEAFKAARGSGKSEFTWNGKSYNTKLKEEAAKPQVSKAPVAAPARPGPSDKAVQTVARVFNRTPNRYQAAIDKADRYFRNAGPSMRSYAKGGKVRGDGCASKGKTKGRMC